MSNLGEGLECNFRNLPFDSDAQCGCRMIVTCKSSDNLRGGERILCSDLEKEVTKQKHLNTRKRKCMLNSFS